MAKRTTSPLFYIFRFFLRVLFKLYFRWEVYGKEHLAIQGGALLAVNHSSGLDPPLAGSPWRRSVYFLGRDTLFKNKLATWFFTVCNTLPISREGFSLHALKRVIGMIRDGEVVVVFPEGTRSPDGEIGSGKVGAGLIAYKARTLIIPCYISGSWEAMPKGSPFFRPHKIRIRYGRPFRCDAYYRQSPTRDTYQNISNTIIERIKDLKREGEES